MSTRKKLTKTARFETFKRDQFTCQYCGRTPPTVTLEIDHMVPVSVGGKNDLENLITACMDCNRGKGARPLTTAPQALQERAAEIEEREAQLAGYKKLIARRKRRENRDISAVEGVLKDACGHQFTASFKEDIRRHFLPHLTVDQLQDAMGRAVSKQPYAPQKAIKYFCGICWAWVRDARGER